MLFLRLHGSQPERYPSSNKIPFRLIVESAAIASRMFWQITARRHPVPPEARRRIRERGTVKLSRICPFCGRILLDQRLIINDLAVAAGGENAAKLLNLTVPSHQPTRQRERQMRRFKSPGQAQRFLTVHGLVRNLFRVGRHLVRAVHHRELRGRSFLIWDAVTIAA